MSGFDIGKRLRDLRNAADVTQKTIAEYLGIARSTYALYETGRNKPSLDTIKRLAAYYAINVDEILEENEEKEIELLLKTIYEKTVKNELKWKKFSEIGASAFVQLFGKEASRVKEETIRGIVDYENCYTTSFADISLAIIYSYIQEELKDDDYDLSFVMKDNRTSELFFPLIDFGDCLQYLHDIYGYLNESKATVGSFIRKALVNLKDADSSTQK